MTRYYAAQRTFWVDPVSGTIVKQTEHANHYYARDPLKPEVTLADYKRHLHTRTPSNRRSTRPATSATGWRCGRGCCRSRSPRSA